MKEKYGNTHTISILYMNYDHIRHIAHRLILHSTTCRQFSMLQNSLHNKFEALVWK